MSRGSSPGGQEQSASAETLGDHTSYPGMLTPGLQQWLPDWTLLRSRSPPPHWSARAGRDSGSGDQSHCSRVSAEAGGRRRNQWRDPRREQRCWQRGLARAETMKQRSTTQSGDRWRGSVWTVQTMMMMSSVDMICSSWSKMSFGMSYNSALLSAVVDVVGAALETTLKVCPSWWLVTSDDETSLCWWVCATVAPWLWTHVSKKFKIN